MMSVKEFDELCDHIKSHGLINPIVLHEGSVVVGRNRLKACNEVGVEPRFTEWDQVGSLVQFVIGLNLKRRNLTSGQSAAASVTENIVLQFTPGAIITIPAGITMKIHSSLVCGPFRIFNCEGTGKVYFFANDRVYPEWFGITGDSSSNRNAIGNAIIAANSMAKVYFSSNIVSDTIDILVSCTLVGSCKPDFDPISNVRNGIWIDTVISASNISDINLLDIGIESRGNSTNEGITISGSGITIHNIYARKRTETVARNVAVIGKSTNNHCFLIENANNVQVDYIYVYYGTQGLAVKATNFMVNKITFMDMVQLHGL